MAKKPANPATDAPRELALSRRALRTVDPPISRLVAQSVANPKLISFAAGLVDEETLPADETLKVAGRVLHRASTGRAALQYGDPQGLMPLRRRLVDHVAELEGRPAAKLGFGAGDLVLSTGSQQMLYLIAEGLLDEGDIVITARPSYFVFTGALASFGARIVGVPMNAGGMDVDALERTLEQLKRSGELARVKFVYCTSFFQNPTGLTLAPNRRKRILDIVQRFSDRHRILLLEDAAYRELQFEGEPLRSIKSYDTANKFVVLTQTFSKPFAPGLKLGYSVLPSDLREQVLRLKGNHDFGSANLCQWIAYEALRSGIYAKHVQRLRRQYRAKRDLMLEALQQGLGDVPGVTWTRPAGGLYIWLTLPEGIDTSGEMLAKSLERNVLYVPGAYAFAEGEPQRNHLRLSFGQVKTRQVRTGTLHLCSVIRKALEKGAR